MSGFHSSPPPLGLVREGDLIAVENEFIRWEFDPARGGELSGAIVKNGSGKNLLAFPQKVSVSLIEGRSYHEFASVNAPAEELEIREERGCPVLSMRQRLADADGNLLEGIAVEREIRFGLWGYSTHQVRFRVEKRISRIGQVQIGTFGGDASFDCCAVREALINSSCGVSPNRVTRWSPMFHGERHEDVPVMLSRWLPVSLLLFRRGVEGIEFSLGDDLGSWDHIGTDIPGWQQTMIAYSPRRKGYEVRLCPLDSLREEQYLEGDYSFSFRMSLPFVRKSVVPLRPCSGNILFPQRGFEKRWPTKEDFAAWKRAGIDLMRLHNDGDCFGNGIFWRDADYPPYPPEEMKKLDDSLAAAKDAGISVVPYFSVKEYHPEAPGFAENSETWARIPGPRDKMLVNRTAHGVFGAQMCLESGWNAVRRETIDQVLSRHAFNGVYYDWCAGAECVNPAHSERRHWDNDRLLEHLEWSHSRSGAKGEVYLHLTYTPSVAAENLASLVLTEESPYAMISPEMFSPHVHFMNIVPRQICDMLGKNSTPEERRKLGLCAILHHATISSPDPVYLELYSAPWMREVGRFRRHTAPGEGIAFADSGAGIGVYWNDREMLAVLANPTDRPICSRWHVERSAMGLPDGGTEPGGTVELAPLELKTISISFS